MYIKLFSIRTIHHLWSGLVVNRFTFSLNLLLVWFLYLFSFPCKPTAGVLLPLGPKLESITYVVEQKITIKEFSLFLPKGRKHRSEKMLKLRLSKKTSKLTLYNPEGDSGNSKTGIWWGKKRKIKRLDQTTEPVSHVRLFVHSIFFFFAKDCIWKTI